MPFGEYENFDDCLAKNSDKDNPSAYCGYIKNQVEEALKHKEAKEAISKATEQTPEQVASLTTPDAGDVPTEEPKDLTSPPTSSKEAENDQASGDGETSPADPAQDQAEPQTNPQDQAKPNGGDNGEDKLEYDGESYHKVNAVEYDDEVYTQKNDKEEAEEDDLEYEDKFWEKADEEILELDDDYYKKDNEQAPVDAELSGGVPPVEEVPDLSPIGESIIIKENGRYKRYNVFQAKEVSPDSEIKTNDKYGKLNGDTYKKNEDELKDERREEHQGQASEQEEIPVEPPAEVKEQPQVPAPQGDIDQPTEEPKVEPVEQKASDDFRAVERIIIKENGKLKFRSVFTEVKKKASKMTR